MLKKAVLLLGIALAAFYLGRESNQDPTSADPASRQRSGTVRADLPEAQGETAIAQAFRLKRTDVPVQSQARIIKALSDDTNGSRHQRILVELPDGQSILIAHNIDLAPRLADIQPGEPIQFKGEYVWNAKGGIVHWTHRDPGGRHAGGWLKYRGETHQ
jgi:hypothetical protein